jgi:hypothetical protein
MARCDCKPGERHSKPDHHILAGRTWNAQHVCDHMAAEADDHSRQPHEQHPRKPKRSHQPASTL